VAMKCSEYFSFQTIVLRRVMDAVCMDSPVIAKKLKNAKKISTRLGTIVDG